MDAGERQMLLVMAETKLQDGYTPTAEEEQVVARLRELATGRSSVPTSQKSLPIGRNDIAPSWSS